MVIKDTQSVLEVDFEELSRAWDCGKDTSIKATSWAKAELEYDGQCAGIRVLKTGKRVSTD